MAKLDSIPPPLTCPSPSPFDPATPPPIAWQRRGSTGRLIVVLPALAWDFPGLARRIWEIARAANLNVLLLSLCSDYYEESHIRRQLVTFAAMIRDDNICTDIRIEHGNDWVRQVKNVYQSGDMIACFAGHKVGLMQKILHEVLSSQLGAPIYILAPDQPVKNPKSKLFLQLSFWLGALVIIGGFFWLEVEIVQMPQDWAHNLLLYLCIFLEFGLLLLWNSISTK